jgi:murein DD-endopeptidase MepM/ murein hydrolase activator NlpD
MSGPLRRPLAVLLACTVLAAASPALASTGGTTMPVNPPNLPLGQGGGTSVGAVAVPLVPQAPVPAKQRAQMPTLVAFSLGATRFGNSGSGLPVSFELAGTTGPVRVKLGVYSRGRLVASFGLGRRSTGRTQSYVLAAGAARKLPTGNLILRLSGVDSRGHHLRGSLEASAAHVVSVSTPAPAPTPNPPTLPGAHTFPLLGHDWSFGGPDARFGAPRSGHTHQGQDVTAPSGTPIVAPAAGTITFVAYQASGAGYYVVMHEAGQNYWYAFMHLLAGSTAVRVGQQVGRGQLIGKVGATGDAEGPHLHFEIWQGPWQAGGRPIDPLPYLQQWAS